MNSNNDVFPELLIPARMLNEYAYCPRLFYLEWIQGEFTHSDDTLYGKFIHKNVDTKSEHSKDLKAIEDNDKIHSRSITLSSYTLGFIAVLDLIENEGQDLIPVDYKKGAIPDNEEKSYEPERVQLCVQALLLRDNGYQCKEGIIYYAQSKTRVTIPITEDLIKRTLQLRDEARQVIINGNIPTPLIDSPKCPRCSLVGICLPDEVHALSAENTSINADDVRRLFPARDDALPIYVQEQGAVITKNGEEIEIKKDREVLARAKLFETSSVHIFGNIQITTQTVHELLEKNIPICYYSYGGWFYGMTHGISHKNILLRQKQFFAANDPSISLQLSQRFVMGKIRNSRTILRRNCDSVSEATLNELYRLSEVALGARSIEELLGIEGAAARIYFSNFDKMLKKRDEKINFEFIYRNRRPPKDPVNAML
ncbi:MAG: CRISPR-associated endonuclease Cas1, partial [Thermoplasmata archaeon]